MATTVDSGSEQRAQTVRIWDSRDCSRTNAFHALREEICSYGLMWQASLSHEAHELQFHIESRETSKARITRSSTGPIELDRTRADIAKSTVDCFRAGLVLSGSMTVVQDCQKVASAGDLVITDLSRPTKLSITSPRFEQIGFAMPKGVSEVLDRYPDRFANLVIPYAAVSTPLKNCFHFLGDRIGSNQLELEAIHDAILSLLPIDAGCFGSREGVPSGVNGLLREILSFVDEHLTYQDLSASFVAKNFDFSERYLFRVFAEHGMRFGIYARQRRLERAAAELRCSNSRHTSITDVAYKWGFGDSSTFSRAFRAHFGCSPRRYRQR